MTWFQRNYKSWSMSFVTHNICTFYIKYGNYEHHIQLTNLLRYRRKNRNDNDTVEESNATNDVVVVPTSFIDDDDTVTTTSNTDACNNKQ
jgi:hypothetical protein